MMTCVDGHGDDDDGDNGDDVGASVLIGHGDNGPCVPQAAGSCSSGVDSAADTLGRFVKRSGSLGVWGPESGGLGVCGSGGMRRP